MVIERFFEREAVGFSLLPLGEGPGMRGRSWGWVDVQALSQRESEYLNR
jgi:hypothetical protein